MLTLVQLLCDPRHTAAGPGSRYLEDRIVSKQAKSESRVSPATLLIASASSLIAAVVVSHIWGRGTLIGAAVTPVIVTLVTEALHRPARVIQTVRVQRGGSFDPIAEGRRGLREGDLAAMEVPAPRIVTARASRRPVRVAIVTGIVAFALAAIALTASDLVVGHSAVASTSDATTLFGGSSGGMQHRHSAGHARKPAEKSSTTSPQPKPAAPAQQAPATTTATPAPSNTSPAPAAPAAAQPQQAAPSQAQPQAAPPAASSSTSAPSGTQ